MIFVHKQRDNFSSAPIALLNALKFFDHTISFSSHYKSLSEQCLPLQQTTPLNLFLPILDSYFEYKETSLYVDFKEHLKKGPIILYHLDARNEPHYSFWYKYSFDKFYSVNADRSEDLFLLSETEIKRLLFVNVNKHDNFLPKAFLIK